MESGGRKAGCPEPGAEGIVSSIDLSGRRWVRNRARTVMRAALLWTSASMLGSGFIASCPGRVDTTDTDTGD